ncbi:hypothetical protein Acsp04_40000 [Actinomadura sp. NBRC 104425]|nr:hypothetical protein Acsp04_40000 [Actinomadura sp. NBRC 104425]
MKIRVEYDGLVFRCAAPAEEERIRIDNSGLAAAALCLILESGSNQDCVVAHAVGWERDMGADREPSRLAVFAPGTDPERIVR